MPLSIVRNDITAMPVDAVVCPSNSSLTPGDGVSGAIFAAAGFDRMQQACRAIGHCDTGDVVMTPGFALPADYVIHTAAPVWHGGRPGESQLLERCYHNALIRAQQCDCRSLASPLISTGAHGYPPAETMHVAVLAISSFLLTHDMDIYLVVHDSGAALRSEKQFTRVQSYLDDHYIGTRRVPRRGRAEFRSDRNRLREQADMWVPDFRMPPDTSETQENTLMSNCSFRSIPATRSLEDVVYNLDESFSRMLLRLIDEKGMTDVETYKRANIDRKLFSKIRKDNGYNPSKPTALALAIALRLDLDETRDLLGKAGYALSHSSKFDVIIEYFIEEGIYDIYAINEALFAFDQKLLGA
ncbi:macro domain-containing protein [Butyricicoccus porcorum]|uniref:Macro domain-containing protein n=1 Tax=Butyricicoccus porcorum TaxID=1945634 RepID=A0A252F7P5_9FIRM|nr:macro domain-containing protein [Butyricicoccus porcorum]OUM21742.1 hypothetical protein CBW42_00470 [Butyricicoccus porcorum]